MVHLINIGKIPGSFEHSIVFFFFFNLLVKTMSLKTDWKSVCFQVELLNLR